VAHIDWPSKPGLLAREQRAEMHTLLDRAAAIGLNALVLQVRPAADALYPSALEPWSEYLTGASGRPPDSTHSSAAADAEQGLPGGGAAGGRLQRGRRGGTQWNGGVATAAS
jgi:hypothetical protein